MINEIAAVECQEDKTSNFKWSSKGLITATFHNLYLLHYLPLFCIVCVEISLTDLSIPGSNQVFLCVTYGPISVELCS